jgi:hypothetical protein
LQEVEGRRRGFEAWETEAGKRKNGVEGGVVETPWSAISSAVMPRSICSLVSLGLIRVRLRCNQVMPDRMTLGRNSPHQVRMFGCGLADQKEGHADAFENRSDPFGSHSIRREFASSLF